MQTSLRILAVGAPMIALTFACGGGVTSEDQARRAYLGLDTAVGKSLQLGFDGFNAANSANIAPQSTSGARTGTLTVTGQVDQGASANKGMRLQLSMTKYSDGDVAPDGGTPLTITYNTADGGALPALNLSLKNIPNGTLTGTLVGDFTMSGGLTGTVHVDLSLSGPLEDDGMGKTQRKAGATSVTGKVTAGNATFDVNVAL